MLINATIITYQAFSLNTVKACFLMLWQGPIWGFSDSAEVPYRPIWLSQINQKMILMRKPGLSAAVKPNKKIKNSKN